MPGELYHEKPNIGYSRVCDVMRWKGLRPSLNPPQRLSDEVRESKNTLHKPARYTLILLSLLVLLLLAGSVWPYDLDRAYDSSSNNVVCYPVIPLG